MRLLLSCLALVLLGGCSKVELASHVAKQVYKSPDVTHKGYFKVGTPYKIAGDRYTPRESYDLVQTGIASWYGPNFDGKMTANGEIFDQNELTAAHKTLQMPSIARVTNLENGRSIIVRINDRGPYSKGRILDLSKRSAEVLGVIAKGTARIRLEVLREESLQVASIAKQGGSTKGFEIALNERGYVPMANRPNVPARQEREEQVQIASSAVSPSRLPPKPISTPPAVQAAPVQAVQQVAYNTNQPVPAAIPAVKPVYIQTASFSLEDNAMSYARRLQDVTMSEIHIEPIQLGDKRFFRVQIPAQNMEDAGNMVQRLKMAGYNQNILIKE